MMSGLVSQTNFKRAAAAKEEVKKIETLAEQFHAENTMMDELAATSEEQLTAKT